MEPLRVALLTPCFWPEVRRGGERYVRELADGLSARGHQPRLITSHPGRPSFVVEDGLPVTRVWRPPDGLLQSRGFEQYMTHVPASYAVLCRGDCDVAHAHFPTDALAAARWGRRTGRPSILTYHGIPDQRGLTVRRLRRRITRKAVRECTAVTAVSHTAARAFEQYPGRPGAGDPPRSGPGDLRRPQPAAASTPPSSRWPALTSPGSGLHCWWRRFAWSATSDPTLG